MKDRDRLIELLEAEGGFSRYITDNERREKLADYLLTNGVIVPPCKVGDKLYYIPFVKTIEECIVHAVEF